MTETPRTKLLTACAFARIFLEAADAELTTKGAEPARLWRKDAQEQLAAALRNLEPPAPAVPTVDWAAVGKELDQL